MYTRKIKLEQTSREAFAELQSYWYGSSKPYFYYVCARMVNPLAYRDHKSLIEDFLEHPNAREIAVFRNNRWDCLRRRTDITRKNLSELVSPRNPDKLIDGVVITRLRRGNHNRGISYASIRFRELNGLIVSIEVKSSPRFTADFTLEKIAYGSHFIGLLDPLNTP